MLRPPKKLNCDWSDVAQSQGEAREVIPNRRSEGNLHNNKCISTKSYPSSRLIRACSLKIKLFRIFVM